MNKERSKIDGLDCDISIALVNYFKIYTDEEETFLRT